VREANAQMSLGPDNSISPYDALFKRYAARYGLDWRLIVAQSYQESQFDPDISNSLGTQGLLQMMPGTARELGFRDLRNPAIGIHAGVRYLRMQLDRIASWDLKPKDRVCFALACYNAGYGHVLDARILAEKTGLDPNIWFGNVESALKLLAKPKYAARARFGYCNAAETVDYVRNIMANYEHYSTLVPE
jgi:membrane-bound lytic murein transglycosylase F